MATLRKTSPLAPTLAVAIALACAVLIGGPLAKNAYATGVCDNYRPSIAHGFCPVNGTISSGEIIYLFGKAALGNEIGLAASRTWGVAYYRAGQPGKWMNATGIGTYGNLGSSNGTLVDPSCTMTGSNVNGNCDVQYTV
jgi:hypothetical protein